MKNNYAGESNTYNDNDHNQLTKDVIAGGTNPRTYTVGYVAAGNHFPAALTGTSPSNQALTCNSGNQVGSAGFGYVGAGNRTAGASVTYNTAGQLTSATKSGSHQLRLHRHRQTANCCAKRFSGGDTYTYSRADQNGLPGIEQVAYTHNGSTVNA